jgi:hypothetical protein
MAKRRKKGSNPLLDQFEEMLNAKYKQKLEINSEFDYIAFMKTVHEELGVGPGRAGRVFNAFLANKIELAEKINDDYGPDKHTGDKQILHTKAEYASLMRRIFSKEDWKKYRTMFILLQEYWEG